MLIKSTRYGAQASASASAPAPSAEHWPGLLGYTAAAICACACRRLCPWGLA